MLAIPVPTFVSVIPASAEAKLITSKPVAPVTVTFAASLLICSVSVPAPPEIVSLVVRVAAANIRVSAPSPSETLSLPVLSVTVSAPVEPVTVSNPVPSTRVAAPRRVTESFPPVLFASVTDAPEDMLIVSAAAPSVTVVPVPPTVIVFAPAARARVSVPVPRSTVRPAAAVPRVIVWFAEVPVRLVMLVFAPRVIVLVFAEVRASTSTRVTAFVLTAPSALTWIVSVPAPPTTVSADVSAAAPKMKMSLPAPPVRLSAPEPVVMDAAVLPLTVIVLAADALPVIVS